MKRTTVREHVAQSRQWLSSIDAAIFTTFTFDPAFFENNVLPLLFDVRDTSEYRRRAQVNNVLLRTNVVVFHDKNHSVRHSGKYRYQVSGMKLKGRFFHPKLIILAGVMENGQTAVTVTVLSANLTLGGWGRQEEVVATLFLESARQRALIKSLSDFLSFLEKTSHQQYEAIEDVRKALKELPPDMPLTSVTDPDTVLYFGGIGNDLSFQEVLAEGKTTQRWDRLLAISPYWHNIVEEAERFPAREFVFIPTKNEFGKYNLTADQADSLSHLSRADSVEFKDFKESTYSQGLFRHAKAYLLQKDAKVRIGIGSCNFTAAGLNGAVGNVEAMMVLNADRSILRNDIEPYLKAIRINENTAASEPDDDAPDHIPFDVSVTFDWKGMLFTYFYELLDTDPIDAHLYLPGMATPIPLQEQTGKGTAVLQTPINEIGEYVVRYRRLNEDEPPYFGAILEINLSDSRKDYVPRLSTQDILESWRASTTDIPLPGQQNPADESNEGEDNNTRAEENPDNSVTEVFNFYDDFRALLDLRSKLREAKRAKQERLIQGYLEFRPDSVRRFVSTLNSIESVERRFCLAKELHALVEENQRYLKNTALLEQIDSIMGPARRELLTKIQSELPTHSKVRLDADEVLNWYETKMGAQ